MNSFYIEGSGELGALARLSEEDARHAARVLRLKQGDAVFAADDGGRRFAAVMETVSERECLLRLNELLPDNEAPVSVSVYQGLPKADKLDWIVQKLTELGATCVAPVKMERCVVKLDEKDGRKRCERLAKIAREASKQCKRAKAPEILAPMTLKQLSERMSKHDLLLTPWEDASGFRMKDAHQAMPEARNIGVVIGPEGGMSAAEVRALEEIGAKTITLGPRILRTETAALTACAMVMTLWGDL